MLRAAQFIFPIEPGATVYIAPATNLWLARTRCDESTAHNDVRPIVPVRCTACGYTRTRLDPLPESDCPQCGVPYATSQRNVELGLLEPAAEAPRAHRADGGGLKSAGLLLVLLMVIGAVWYFVLSPAEAPEAVVGTGPAVLKGSIGAPASAQPQVVMFATSWCPYCAKARSFFRRHGIQYTEHDIENDAAGYAAYSKLGGGGVPVIVVGDRTVRGYNERELAALLGPWLGKRGG